MNAVELSGIEPEGGGRKSTHRDNQSHSPTHTTENSTASPKAPVRVAPANGPFKACRRFNEVAPSNRLHPSHQQGQRNVTRDPAQSPNRKINATSQGAGMDSASDVDKNDDSGGEDAFNETLKRMLKTPPTPHDKPGPLESQDVPLDQQDKKRV